MVSKTGRKFAEFSDATWFAYKGPKKSKAANRVAFLSSHWKEAVFLVRDVLAICLYYVYMA